MGSLFEKGEVDRVDVVLHFRSAKQVGQLGIRMLV